MNRDMIRGNLDLLLLGALRAGPAHGYAVIEQLRGRTDGLIDLGDGTVYPALHGLEREGLLESEWAEVGGRRRRVYQLTKKGRRALGERLAVWDQFVAAMSRVAGEATA